MLPDEGSPFDALRTAFANAPSLPEVDRVAVHDTRSLSRFERREQTPSLARFDSIVPPALLGIPVVIDEQVDVGVIEFRNGDEVVRRFHLPELSA